MRPLTSRQATILEFICQAVRTSGFPPTVREIGQRFGIRSVNGVSNHLAALERKGMLERFPRRCRTWVPVAGVRSFDGCCEGGPAKKKAAHA